MDTVGFEFPEELSSKSAEGTTNNFSALFLSIVNLDNLYEAYLEAAKGKRNRINVYKFEQNLLPNLNKLLYELLNNTYKPSPPTSFIIKCPSSGKERLIEAPHFKDSVVQHAIYRQVYWIFDKKFIHQSYGCRIGKGTLKCADECQAYMRQHDGESYYLQMDFKKYYYSIDRNILLESVKHLLPVPDVVNLLALFIFTDDKKQGLGIGNLLSQLFGLIYLNRFDHYLKRVIKAKHYLRYVDDSVIIGISLQEAKEIKQHLIEWCDEHLKLTFSKIKIHKIKKGINFVGYRTWRSKRFVRKKTLQNFRIALRKEKIQSLNAILEHSLRTTTFAYFIRILLKYKYIYNQIHHRYKIRR